MKSRKTIRAPSLQPVHLPQLSCQEIGLCSKESDAKAVGVTGKKGLIRCFHDSCMPVR
jgi:hypothetical protein